MCHGQEVAVKANAGDPDALGGVWVFEDGGVSRGGYLKGLIYLKYSSLVDWGGTEHFGGALHPRENFYGLENSLLPWVQFWVTGERFQMKEHAGETTSFWVFYLLDMEYYYKSGEINLSLHVIGHIF